MFLVKKILTALVLPPVGPVLLALLGLWVARRRPRTGGAIALLALLGLIALSLPLVAGALVESLEGARPISAQALARAQAIVILGGGTYWGAPEYGGDTAGSSTLERVRYGAHLQRRSGLPILVSGGAPFGGRTDAETMKEVIEREFGGRVDWVETAARDTAENAAYSSSMLKSAGITRIALVSAAWHLPRAVALFERQGLEVLPAPTGFTTQPPLALARLLPSAAALATSSQALREWLGILVQRWTRQALGGRSGAATGLWLLTTASAAWAQSDEPAQAPQETLFKHHCAVCHENPVTRAPGRAALRAMAPEFVVSALTSGIMQAEGAPLSPGQRASLAEYLTGRKIGAQAAMAGRCTVAAPPFSLDAPAFNGWGANPENWRYQPDPGFAAAQLGRLELKWAFGFPGAIVAFGQPTIAGGRVFVGAQNGHVYSLDAATGCYYWDYTAGTGVRTAITVARIGGKHVALFGDRRGRAYSVDVATGDTIWKVAADDQPSAQITGAPVLFESRLYVPISVGDDSAAIDPKYECCKGRGAVVALDAVTGRQIWKTYTLPQATPQSRNSIGTQRWGPSGASVWAAPTIDAKLRVLYVGTGDNHSAPATDTSDAVIAMSLDSGQIFWSRQLTAGDMGNGACLAADKTNCPEPPGPDVDLGASPHLIALPGGKRILVIGQKNGVLWGLDPDDSGRIGWKTRVGKGGLLGGVQWGTATDGKAVYAAVSDIAFVDLVLSKPIVFDPRAGGGLHAIDASTGATLWYAPPAQACAGRTNCSPAQSGAVTATPEFVFSGSVDGHVRAYSTATGEVLWDYDTARPFTTTNGVSASGGSLDSAGPTIAGGMLFVGSGYGLYGGQPGNVLLAFAPRR